MENCYKLSTYAAEIGGQLLGAIIKEGKGSIVLVSTNENLATILPLLLSMTCRNLPPPFSWLRCCDSCGGEFANDCGSRWTTERERERERGWCF